MNKNIIIKSIAALTILTSITGVGTTVRLMVLDKNHQSKNRVKLITNTNVAPYSGVSGWALNRIL